MGKKCTCRVAFVLACFSAALTGCVTIASRDRIPAASPQSVVSAYLDTLNRRDLLAMTAYVTPNVEWYSVVNGERVLEIADRESLSQMLSRYYAQYDRAQWTAERIETAGQIVAVLERSQWTKNERVESRSGLAVYEVEAGRIRRITYFLQSH